jgi:hypothetical protein
MVLPDEDTATFIQQCINNARASLLIRNHDADISKREQDIPDLLDSDADNQDSIKQYHTHLQMRDSKMMTNTVKTNNLLIHLWMTYAQTVKQITRQQ